MISKKTTIFFALCMIILGITQAFSSSKEKTVQLTAEERSWLEAHPVIRLAPDPEFQPIEFFDEEGKYSGIGADYAKLISEKLGIKFEIVQCANWNEVVEKAKNRKIDVLNAVVKTPQREKYLIFPPPYLKTSSVIIVRKGVSDKLTLEMLEDMHVVMVSEYGYVDLIRNKHPEIKIDLVISQKTALRKVSFGMADAFVGDLLTASFYIEQEGITNLKLGKELQPPNTSGFAVRSDWPVLSQILEKGVNMLTEDEKNSIYSKWIHLQTAPGLTTQEVKKLSTIILTCVFLIILGFLLWNRSLNHNVQQRTKDLKKEVDERKKAEYALKEAHSELEKRVERRTKDLSEEIKNREILEDELAKEKTFLEVVLQNIQEGVIVCDKNGILTLFNRASREIHGLPELSVTPDQWADHYLADGITKMHKSDIPLFRALQGESIKNFEITVIPKSKPPASYISSSQPLRDENNVIIGAVATMHDITEEKRAEIILRDAHIELEKKVKERTNELQLSLKKLEEETAERKKMEMALMQSHKMEAIGTLAGGIAHDFNNILAAIIGYADMAIDYIPENSPAKHQIEQVLKAGDRAKDLIQHILTFSRNESQIRVPTEIYATVKEATKFLRASTPTTIEIKENVDEKSGTILADETQINQVVVNLCTNAAHAMEEDGGVLEISLAPYEHSKDGEYKNINLKQGSYIMLSVKDNGPGVDPEIIDKIFDPYFTTKGIGKGSGMGLAVVQGIVKNHDGFITVDSSSSGTTFTAFFPKIQKSSSKKKKTNELIPTGTEKILIVDDEEIIARMTKRIVESLGYKATSTTNSLEALTIFKANPDDFDLVISDQTMPDLTGDKLSKKILNIRKDIPIIICSGYNSKIDELRNDAIGIAKFIMKPVRKQELAKTIREVLDNRQPK
ncbi:MAG: transporter substrate-binding domain-containing protein [Kiritimatiellae bacterium]|jgi:PAS domain S-box-containing protein|nr:transporter substrate-binding domain-containing protein [Kiritimatiellia bacterium]